MKDVYRFRMTNKLKLTREEFDKLTTKEEKQSMLLSCLCLSLDIFVDSNRSAGTQHASNPCQKLMRFISGKTWQGRQIYWSGAEACGYRVTLASGGNELYQFEILSESR